MMTLEEAISQFSTQNKSRAEVTAAYGPWKSMVEEIAKSSQAAQFLANSIPFLNRDLVKGLYMIFSAGVIVGCSMERAELLAELSREVS